jgi:hypothetical protein
VNLSSRHAGLIAVLAQGFRSQEALERQGYRSAVLRSVMGRDALIQAYAVVGGSSYYTLTPLGRETYEEGGMDDSCP